MFSGTRKRLTELSLWSVYGTWMCFLAHGSDLLSCHSGQYMELGCVFWHTEATYWAVTLVSIWNLDVFSGTRKRLTELSLWSVYGTWMCFLAHGSDLLSCHSGQYMELGCVFWHTEATYWAVTLVSVWNLDVFSGTRKRLTELSLWSVYGTWMCFLAHGSDLLGCHSGQYMELGCVFWHTEATY